MNWRQRFDLFMVKLILRIDKSLTCIDDDGKPITPEQFVLERGKR